MASGSESYSGVNAGRKARANTKANKRGKTMKPQGSKLQTAAEAGTPF